MKQRSSSDKVSRSQSVANEVGQRKSTANYQIDDRRSASVMQRKFRNLANGLESARLIQPKSKAPSFQSKTKPFTK